MMQGRMAEVFGDVEKHKAHGLCERVAQRTGGAVLPTFFFGTGGGHVGYKWNR